MSDYAGYIKDLKSGNILGIQRRSSIEQVEMENMALIKQRKEHLIKFKVLTSDEVIEYLKGIHKPQVVKLKNVKTIEAVEVKKKPGKKTTKK